MTFRAAFGGDHDDTVGGARTVKGSGGRVLENGQVFNVIRVDRGKVAIERNSIHYIERV